MSWTPQLPDDPADHTFEVERDNVVEAFRPTLEAANSHLVVAEWVADHLAAPGQGDPVQDALVARISAARVECKVAAAKAQEGFAYLQSADSPGGMAAAATQVAGAAFDAAMVTVKLTAMLANPTGAAVDGQDGTLPTP